MKKRITIDDLTVTNKRTIVYLYLNKLIPTHKIANSLKIDRNIISDYLSFLLSDEQEQDKYLPEDLYDRKNKRFKNTFPKGSYYSHLVTSDDEMKIASDWLPQYSSDGIENEYIYISVERLSFTERLNLLLSKLLLA